MTAARGCCAVKVGAIVAVIGIAFGNREGGSSSIDQKRARVAFNPDCFSVTVRPRINGS